MRPHSGKNVFDDGWSLENIYPEAEPDLSLTHALAYEAIVSYVNVDVN